MTSIVNSCDIRVFRASVLGRGPFGTFRKNLKSLAGPKYKAEGLEDLLLQYLDDDIFLSDMLTPVIIPAFDIKLQQPVFFSSSKVGPSFNAFVILSSELTRYEPILRQGRLSF